MPRKPDRELADSPLDAAVRALARRDLSTRQLDERLVRAGVSTAARRETLETAERLGYLNDERFAFGYASYRVRQKPMGRQRLKRDLQLKKVDRATADEALRLVFEETPEEELIDRAIKKRTRLRGLPHTRAEIKSLIDHLLRQGFSYELIAGKVRAISAADVDEDDTSVA